MERVQLEQGMEVLWKHGYEIDGNVTWRPCKVDRVTGTVAIISGTRFRRTVNVSNGEGLLTLVKPRMWGPSVKLIIAA